MEQLERSFRARRFPDELNRIITHAHQSNMKVVVYASPHYFTKGSSFDGREWNPCFGTGTGDPVGLELGGNSSSYLDALSKLLNDYPELDGVYFDEIYPFNLPESYAVTRETRKLLGSGKIIMYHNTQGTAGSPWSTAFVLRPAYSPTVEAYTDYTASGEIPGDQNVVFTQDYLRYRVSTYNISNSVGLIVNYFVYSGGATSKLPFAHQISMPAESGYLNLSQKTSSG